MFLKLFVVFHFCRVSLCCEGTGRKSGACTSFVINPLFAVIVNFPYKLHRFMLLEDQVEISEGKIGKF